MNMIRVYVALWLMNRYQQVLNLNYTKTAINKKQRRTITYEYGSSLFFWLFGAVALMMLAGTFRTIAYQHIVGRGEFETFRKGDAGDGESTQTKGFAAALTAEVRV